MIYPQEFCLSAQAFHSKVNSWEITQKGSKGEQPFLNMTHRLDLIYMSTKYGPTPGVLGIWGEWLFIFRELGSTSNYFQGFGEQSHSFGHLGSPAKK